MNNYDYLFEEAPLDPETTKGLTALYIGGLIDCVSTPAFDLPHTPTLAIVGVAVGSVIAAAGMFGCIRAEQNQDEDL